MRVRPSSRVVLIDPLGRVLLLRVEDPATLGPGAAWILPGGGLEPGESWEDAARREVREETGVELAAVGPCVWTRRIEITLRGGRIVSDERYFVARVPAAEPTGERQTDAAEARTFREFRWWDATALLDSGQRVLPPDLPALVAPLIAGNLPPTPLVVA